VSIPPKYREELGEKFFIACVPRTKDKKEIWLTAYSQSRWQSFMKALEEMPRGKQDALSTITGNALECEPDSQGRILLTKTLRDAGRLNKTVALVGKGSTMQIWDSDMWADFNSDEDVRQDAAAIFDEMVF
jgi:MraZ protein